jgi:hypothetical protein
MKKLLLLLLVMGVITCAWTNPVKTPTPLSVDTVSPADSTPAAKTYHYQLFTRPDGAFGYDVFSGNKKIIHQETVPGVPGNKGFTSKKDAIKVAELLVSKLQKNIFPPTITTEELKQLHVL